MHSIGSSKFQRVKFQIRFKLQILNIGKWDFIFWDWELDNYLGLGAFFAWSFRCCAPASFDLHALSTPPAFILDQDQILIQNPTADASITVERKNFGTTEKWISIAFSEWYWRVFMGLLFFKIHSHALGWDARRSIGHKERSVKRNITRFIRIEYANGKRARILKSAF